MEFKPATLLVHEVIRRLMTRKVLFAMASVVGVVCLVTVYYYIKVSAMVDKAFSGGLFERSAKIYAIAPGNVPSKAGPSGTGKAFRVSLQEVQQDDSSEPELITNFFDATRARRRVVT